MNDDSSEHGKQFFIPIFLTVITVIMGLISFHTVFPDYPFLRKLYYSFQLFTLESGDRFYENGNRSIAVTFIFNLARYLAVATLVITIVLAILSVLRYKYFLSRVRFMKGHTILCGLGEVGEAMAESFRDKKRLVIIEKDTCNDYLSGLKKAGVKIIEANALDKTVLSNIGIEHAKSLAAVTGDDFVNITIINQVLELLRDKGPDENKVTLTADIDSRNLKTAITEEWKKERRQPETELHKNLMDYHKTALRVCLLGGTEALKEELTVKYNITKQKLLDYEPEGEDFKSCRGNIKLFNINQLAARYIFRIFPPDRFRSIIMTDQPAMNILILGFSKIGEELFKLCVQNCHYINRRKTRITLVSNEADEFMKRINSIYTNIHNLIDFRAVNLNPHHLTGKLLLKLDLEDVDVVYICSEEDHYQASYSSRVKELYRLKKIPIVRPFYRNKTWNTTNPPENLYSFNILDKVAVLERIIDEYFDRKAIAVHHRWLKLEISGYITKIEDCISRKINIPDPKPTMVPWHLLDEETRDDNRSVVEHINVKLRSMRQLTDPALYDTPEKASIDYSFLLNTTAVRQLAEIEHRRWMATKFLYGWDPGPKRDQFLREHESLVEFRMLDPSTQLYDINQIKQIKEIVEL